MEEEDVAKARSTEVLMGAEWCDVDGRRSVLLLVIWRDEEERSS